MQGSNLSPGWTHALIAWGVIAPLAGILLGHVLARSWQGEQTRMDNIKGEYRELLSALASAYTTFIRLGPRDPHSPEQRKAYEETRAASLRVFHDRIYIANRVDQDKWLFRWTVIEAAYKNDDDRLTFSNDFMKFQDKIRKAAFEDLESVGLVSGIRLRYLAWRKRKRDA